jgi:AcrR family transcriptional regulator|tara:strand:- start:639 stop:1406 length:768 start_codon:yes stop_codon:yes gene_type:complete
MSKAHISTFASAIREHLFSYCRLVKIVYVAAFILILQRVMPKRSPEHMNAQRERILRATIRCIGKLGLEKTSVATIRSEADLSTGAIYKHFESKDEIVTAALQFAAMNPSEVPHRWPPLRDDLAALEEQRGFDVTTLARANLELLASGLRPGLMRDLLKPQMEQAFALLAERLMVMEAAGEIRLKMSALRTATCLIALTEGQKWLGLAGEREFKDISADIAAGLECLVEPIRSTSSEISNRLHAGEAEIPKPDPL